MDYYRCHGKYIVVLTLVSDIRGFNFIYSTSNPFQLQDIGYNCQRSPDSRLLCSVNCDANVGMSFITRPAYSDNVVFIVNQVHKY